MRPGDLFGLDQPGVNQAAGCAGDGGTALHRPAAIGSRALRALEAPDVSWPGPASSLGGLSAGVGTEGRDPRRGQRGPVSISKAPAERFVLTNI